MKAFLAEEGQPGPQRAGVLEEGRRWAHLEGLWGAGLWAGVHSFIIIIIII